MGVFVSVIVTCPHCEHENEIQTGYGDAHIAYRFGAEAIPLKYLEKVVGTQYCEECEEAFQVMNVWMITA